MTGKELSAILAECAARTEIARAGVEEARRKQEAAVAKQEAAVAKHRDVIAEHERVAAEQRVIAERLNKQNAEAEAQWQEYRKESAQKTDAIIAELKEHRDERRALLEAIFRVIDRLDQQQPPPPNLRSV
jgi:hypothetical protein